MEYVVYKITNKTTGHFYIGVHQCESWEKSKYFGSGTRLKEMIKKEGKENFLREMLYNFNTKKEMLDKEAEIVTPELISDVLCLNMVYGGKAGKNGFGFKKKNIQRKRTNPKKLQ